MSETQIDTGVVGGGGREHELARQLASNDTVRTVYCFNGNAGIANLEKGHNVDVKPTDIENIVRFAHEKQLGLVVVGPETPLVNGLADRLRGSLQDKNILVFGPNAKAARLEGSKAFATEFTEACNIPHPPTVITTSYNEALAEIKSRATGSYVIKADGLAGGKGVVLPDSFKKAEVVIKSMFLEGGYNGAGKDKVLIQERYHGPELSVLAVTDGSKFVILPYSQDHKRLKDGDKGPNTGGMGAYAPVLAHFVTPTQERGIQDIVERTIYGTSQFGMDFKGVVYVGIMLAEELDGAPVVIEYNVRFGDPETQVVLPVLSEAGIDVFDMLKSAAEGKLNDIYIPRFLGSTALTVCLAAKGYPDNPKEGAVIHGLDKSYEGVIIHHGATENIDGRVITVGGRALYVTGIAPNVDEAANNAYGVIGQVGFDGMQCRTDIGYQARKMST